MRKYVIGLLGMVAPFGLAVLQAGDAPKPVPPGTPVTIQVVPYSAPTPTVDFTLHGRHGHVYPHHAGCVHTGSGYIDVQQPTTDAIVVTMTGIAVATGSPAGPGAASMDFDLDQCIEVVFEKPEVKYAKVTMEGRVIGLLRSECKGGGSAEESNACATISCGPAEVLTVCAPAHSVCGGENLSINDHEGPVNVPIKAGKYQLHQTFHIGACHAKAILPCKAASAEFAPDPALDPLWISYWEPFHGVAKKDFGFQVTIKVSEESNPPEGTNGKEEGPKENLPAPPPGALPVPPPAPKPDGKEGKPVGRLILSR